MHHLQVCSKISGHLQKFRTWSKFQDNTRPETKSERLTFGFVSLS